MKCNIMKYIQWSHILFTYMNSCAGIGTTKWELKGNAIPMVDDRDQVGCGEEL
jgi:hypothetical protein